MHRINSTAAIHMYLPRSVFVHTYFPLEYKNMIAKTVSAPPIICIPSRLYEAADSTQIRSNSLGCDSVSHKLNHFRCLAETPFQLLRLLKYYVYVHQHIMKNEPQITAQ